MDVIVREERVSCIGASPGGIYVASDFNCTWAGFALLFRWKYAFAIVAFIQPIFTDNKHGTEVGVEGRDGNNSNSDIKFTLCQTCS